MTTSTSSTRKRLGRVYTPERVVREILDLSGYFGESILRKHVLDNSCGDGAFLCEIVERYCRASRGVNLRFELECYIHGVELDVVERARCVERLNEISRRYGVDRVHWDVNVADALTLDCYKGKMDFVLGNPPYVRVHHLGDSFQEVKRHEFAQDGMTDLYLVFYEIGLEALNERGTLGFITPSSFFTSRAGERFRRRVVQDDLLARLVDLKHYQAFNAATYTTIVVLQKSRAEKTTEYYEYDGVLRRVATLTSNEYFIDGHFYFSTPRRLNKLREIFANGNGSIFQVKNGFATLADAFFINDSLDERNEFVIPVVKASTGVRSKCLFPYRQGKLVSLEELRCYSKLYAYFKEHETLLRGRSLADPDEWHGFGRTQGIVDVYKSKYAINSLIRTSSDIKLSRCESGVGIYSGLYILSELDENILRKFLFSEDFNDYVVLLQKYKSGGYYTFSSKELKVFLEAMAKQYK